MITHEIDLNVSQPNNKQFIHINQGEYDSVKIVAHIWAKNKPYTIDADKIRIEGKLSSGALLFDGDSAIKIIKENDTTVSFILTKPIAASVGSFNFSLLFYKGSDVLKKTFPFTIRVSGNPANNVKSDAVLDGVIKKLEQQEQEYNQLATVATSGSYTDLSNKPTIGNGKVTVNQNGTTKGTFTMNQTGDTIINLTGSDTNTWRDVVDSLDSTRTDASLSANQGRVLNDKFASYLPLHGGTTTGRIVKNTNGSWVGDRDRAVVYSMYPGDDSYGCVACMPTKNGSWSMGNLGGVEHLIFNYVPDANYSANKNESIHVYLRPTGGTIALTSDIPASLPASDVYAWAKASSKPSYSWGEIGGRPTALSSFTNDSGFITGSDSRLTNTTYSLIQDSADGHKLTFKGSDGSTTTVTIPDNDHNDNTTYSLKKTGSKIQLIGSDGSTTEVTDDNTTYDLDAMINALPVGTDNPVDNDYYVSQYADGGTSNTRYYRRPVSKLWNYIKTKLATVATSGSYTDLSNKPTIGNGKVTVNQNGTTKGTFTMNQTGDTIINLTGSDTNTWRDVVDSLDSTRTDASLSANQGRVLNDKFASYLPLHGGTTTGRIVKNTNGSWVGDRDRAVVYSMYPGDDSYGCVACMPTKNGSWSMGNLGGVEHLIFNYVPDANYSANKNESIHVYLRPTGGTIALTSDIPASLPASDVYAWAKASSKPSYSWGEIGGRPTALSSFTNDSGFITGSDSRLTNARPASDVYSWAKASSKPSYTWTEISNKPDIPSISKDTPTRTNWTISSEYNCVVYRIGDFCLAVVAVTGTIYPRQWLPAAKLSKDFTPHTQSSIVICSVSGSDHMECMVTKDGYIKMWWSGSSLASSANICIPYYLD